MDSYFVTIENPGTFKVGEKAIFKGSAGLKVDRIELVVDGYSLGEVGFGRPGPESKQWQLEYVFNGAGKARKLQALVKASDGQIIQNRVQEIDVKAGAAPKPEAKPDVKPLGKFPVTIVESKIRHAVRWNNKLVGLVIHYSAGYPSNDPTGLLQMGVRNGYTYWALTPQGVIHKTTGINEFGWHVGMARHKNHIGLEVASPGKLRSHNGRWHPWYHWDSETGLFKEGSEPWPEDQVRYFKGSKTQIQGAYAKFTPEQEAGLVGLIQFLKDSSPDFKIENVVGHDTAMTEIGLYGEKQDPGGSLSMSIEDFREYLKKVIV